MKNKKNIAILIPVVLLIWGAVIYQFFSYADSDNQGQAIPHQLELKSLKIKERDTFSVDIRYRDPFLGKMYVDKVKTTKIKKESLTKKKVAEPIDWPTLVYKGIVSDVKDKKQVYMLIVNGKTCLMKRGETQSDIFLKEGNRFNITVKYKNDWKTIALQD